GLGNRPWTKGRQHRVGTFDRGVDRYWVRSRQVCHYSAYFWGQLFRIADHCCDFMTCGDSLREELPADTASRCEDRKFHLTPSATTSPGVPRSEERRVGKECRSRWWTDDEKKKGEKRVMDQA